MPRAWALALVLAPPLAACDDAKAASAAGAPSASSQSAAPSKAAACASLDRASCLRATHCTLVIGPDKVKQPYLCRDAKGACERDIMQGDSRACEKRDGCVHDKGGCYCPCKDYGRTAVPDAAGTNACACVCAGGPPPRCRSQDEKPALGAAPIPTLSATATAAPAAGSASAAGGQAPTAP